MLPTNFAGLAHRRPRLRRALEALEDWIKANPTIDFIDIRLVLSEKAGVDQGELSVALVVLEKEGLLREKIGLIAPTNYALADDFFDLKEKLPDVVYDTTDRPFDPEDAESIPIYVEASR